MSEKMAIVAVKKGNYGITYRFVIRAIDLSDASGYEGRLTVWSVDDVDDKLIDGALLTDTYDAVTGNTLCDYVIQEGDCDVVGDYFAEITWTHSAVPVVVRTSKTFMWKVVLSTL